MVTVASSGATRVAPTGLLSVDVKSSACSRTKSSTISTSTVLDVSPWAKVSVPDADAKSCGVRAVPGAVKYSTLTVSPGPGAADRLTVRVTVPSGSYTPYVALA